MPLIICPLCKALLAKQDRSWRCPSGHSFDEAREGYINLLPVQQKKSREPGDAADMVQARREFLDAGHYAPLRDAVAAQLAPLKAGVLLDIGCGEGFYTAAMASVAQEVVGLDIAKPAVRMAARRIPGVTWLVASGAHLPLADQSVDVVCSLFSPLPVAEMARVLKPEGHLLVVTPGPLHLESVRAALFDSVIAHQPEKFLQTLGSHFRLVHETDVRFPLSLSQQALRQLLLMTPYVWRAKAEARAALEQASGWETEAWFSVYLLQKIAA